MNYFPVSYAFPTPPPPIDDHIGGESCVDLKSFDDVAFSLPTSETMSSDPQIKEATLERQCSFIDRQQLCMKKKYTPLIPRILERYYTSDGRLILREEKLKHHEYFLAHRENGRLTLRLVPLNGDVFEDPLPLDDQSEVEGDNKLEMDDNTKEYHKLDNVDALKQDIDTGNDMDKNKDKGGGIMDI